jgi:hypothetical protein
MPDADYGFKPSPDVRSFGQQVAHVADDQYNLCALLSRLALRASAALLLEAPPSARNGERWSLAPKMIRTGRTNCLSLETVFVRALNFQPPSSSALEFPKEM